MPYGHATQSAISGKIQKLQWIRTATPKKRPMVQQRKRFEKMKRLKFEVLIPINGSSFSTCILRPTRQKREKLRRLPREIAAIQAI